MIALMTLQFLNWLWVLAQADLSYAKPAAALSYASVPVMSALLLDEPVDSLEIAGLACVITGVWFISRTSPLSRQEPGRP